MLAVTRELTASSARNGAKIEISEAPILSEAADQCVGDFPARNISRSAKRWMAKIL